MIEIVRDPAVQRGLIWLAASAGIVLSPQALEAIVIAGTAVAGLVPLVQRVVEVFLKDQEKT